jgi:hypothetical protein
LAAPGLLPSDSFGYVIIKCDAFRPQVLIEHDDSCVREQLPPSQ